LIELDIKKKSFIPICQSIWLGNVIDAQLQQDLSKMNYLGLQVMFGLILEN
jgi:hypothetical protein